MTKKYYATHAEVHDRMMKRPGYKEAYEALEPEFAIYEAIIDARIQRKMTQRQLAEKAGIAQSALSRIESGKINSTLQSIQKLLALTGRKLKIVQA